MLRKGWTFSGSITPLLLRPLVQEGTGKTETLRETYDYVNYDAPRPLAKVIKERRIFFSECQQLVTFHTVLRIVDEAYSIYTGQLGTLPGIWNLALCPEYEIFKANVQSGVCCWASWLGSVSMECQALADIHVKGHTTELLCVLVYVRHLP